jgi:hypothetical protein
MHSKGVPVPVLLCNGNEEEQFFAEELHFQFRQEEARS